MPRKPNKHPTGTVLIRTSAEVRAYLDELSKIGIHGKTPAEVAKTLIGIEIERLIRDRIIHLRRARGA